MRNDCPIKDLLKFIKETKKNPLNKVPQKLVKHAESCEECSDILSNPELWDSLINIYDSLATASANQQRKTTNLSLDTDSIKEGMVCRIKIENTSNSVFALTTDVSSLKSGFIRVSPIIVSPKDEDIDQKTDIIIPASKMPTGLPSLIEWWNDRPVLANSINSIFGEINTSDYKEIKQRISNQPKVSNPTRSILLFREIEKSKGNQISATFFEKFISSNIVENEFINKQPSQKSFEVKRIKESNSKKRPNVLSFPSQNENYSVYFYDLFPANEELRMAADSSDIYKKLKEYLNKNKNGFKLRKMNDGTDSFTIENIEKKPFILLITNKDGKEKKLESNDKGKLYIKEGLKEFEKIEFKPE